jgi:hypothetical protein
MRSICVLTRVLKARSAFTYPQASLTNRKPTPQGPNLNRQVVVPARVLLSRYFGNRSGKPAMVNLLLRTVATVSAPVKQRESAFMQGPIHVSTMTCHRF